MKPRSIVRVLAVLALAAGTCGCAHRPKTPVSVFFAGSLIIPFGELEKAFEASRPNIDLLMEGHGSIQVIRHVTDIHELIDVVVTADSALIPLLMYESRVPETGRPYATWYARFATNRLALAYRPQSRHAAEITADNWYDILQRPDVKWGVSDPRFDAVGYRALMAIQRAESLYGESMLFEELVTGNFKAPVRVLAQDGRWLIQVPELLETRPDINLLMRSYSIQLISLLEAGELDYAFEYESVIRQHGLLMVALPDEVNLGFSAEADNYAHYQVKLDFQRFASVQPVFTGDVIGYGVTIPTNAPHPVEAEAFVAFLLGSEGRRILEANHQPLIVPVQADHLEALPAGLQGLCVPLE